MRIKWTKTDQAQGPETPVESVEDAVRILDIVKWLSPDISGSLEQFSAESGWSPWMCAATGERDPHRYVEEAPTKAEFFIKIVSLANEAVDTIFSVWSNEHEKLNGEKNIEDTLADLIIVRDINLREALKLDSAGGPRQNYQASAVGCYFKSRSGAIEFEFKTIDQRVLSDEQLLFLREEAS